MNKKELLEIISRYDPDNVEINQLISCYIRNTQIYRRKLYVKYINLYGFSESASIKFADLVELTWKSKEKEIRYIAIKSIQKYLNECSFT